MSIGVINKLRSTNDFNVSSTLLFKSDSTICWKNQMGKSPRRRGQRGRIKTLTERKNPSNESSEGYKAPTVGYKDIMYSHKNTKATATFGTVHTKLARYASVQSWSGATIVGRAMEKLARPTMIAPKLHPPIKEYKASQDREVPDPDK